MRKNFLKYAAAVFFSVLGLSACQPSLNWRTVQMPETTLSLELPCKPDKTTKPVTMAGQTLELSVVGCEAGDAVRVVHAVVYQNQGVKQDQSAEPLIESLKLP